MSCDVWTCSICGYKVGLSWGDVSGPGICPVCHDDKDWLNKANSEKLRLEEEVSKLKDKLCPAYKSLRDVKYELNNIKQKISKFDIDSMDDCRALIVLIGEAQDCFDTMHTLDRIIEEFEKL